MFLKGTVSIVHIATEIRLNRPVAAKSVVAPCIGRTRRKTGEGPHMHGKHAAPNWGVSDVELWTSGADKHRKRTRTVLFAGLCILALCALAVSAALCSMRTVENTDDDTWKDPTAQVGYYAGKSDEEIQADLNAKVAEGMFNISINSLIEVDANAQANARIENIAANRFDMKVVIAPTDSPNDILYESGALSPGEYIQTIGLNRSLEPGHVPCTATFTALDPATHTQKGMAAAEIVLVAS